MTTDNIGNKIDNGENPESLEDIIKGIEKVTQENLELLKNKSLYEMTKIKQLQQEKKHLKLMKMELKQL